LPNGPGFNRWFKLTPGLNGHYTNGTWSSIATSLGAREFFSSQVLRDGRVFLAGGEDGGVTLYGTNLISNQGTTNSEIYDPVSDSWTELVIPPGVIAPLGFSDSGSVLLNDGRVLIEPVNPGTTGNTCIYDPVANSWMNVPLVRGVDEDEASWLKLPDGSVLVVDTPYPGLQGGTNSERFIPALGRWIDDGTQPVSTYSL